MTTPISRRSVITAIAALPAAAAPGHALAPPPAPDTALGAPAAALTPEARFQRLQDLLREAAELLRHHGDGQWVAEIYPASVAGVMFRRRDRIYRSAGLYEVRTKSGPRIVIAEPDGDFTNVSHSIAQHDAGGSYRQSKARFDRRMIRRVGGLEL